MDQRTERAAVTLDGDVGVSPHLICSVVKQVTPVACFLFSQQFKKRPCCKQERPRCIKEDDTSDNQMYCISDTLLVEVAQQIDRGEVGIFIIRDRAFVKMLGETELISLNEEYSNIPLTEDTKCMGRVVGKL